MTLCCPEYREKAQLEPINKYANSLATSFHKVPFQTITRNTANKQAHVDAVGSNELRLLNFMGTRPEDFDGCVGRHSNIPQNTRGGCGCVSSR